ncbi:hypothetical protein AAVH_27723 [Aphelenchoides avenae]|nr:hypothetical protein AAVH_27723 [Aphelenchus avenae]
MYGRVRRGFLAVVFALFLLLDRTEPAPLSSAGDPVVLESHEARAITRFCKSLRILERAGSVKKSEATRTICENVEGFVQVT